MEASTALNPTAQSAEPPNRQGDHAVMTSGQTHELLAERVVVGPKSQVGLKGLKRITDFYPVLEMDAPKFGLQITPDTMTVVRSS